MLIKMRNELDSMFALDVDKASRISRIIINNVKWKDNKTEVVIDFTGINVTIYDFIRKLLLPLHLEGVRYNIINTKDDIEKKIKDIEEEFKRV